MRIPQNFADFRALVADLITDAPKRFNSLPSWYLETPQGAEAIDEATARHLAERADLVREIEATKDGAETAIRPLVEALPSARAREAAAIAELRAAKEERTRIETELFGLRVSRDQRVDRVRAELRMGADPLLDAFSRAIEDEHERLRRATPDVAEFGPANVSGQRHRVSNRPAILERLEALRAALLETEALKLAALDRDELLAALEEIHAGVPGVAAPENFIPAAPVAAPTVDDADRRVIARDAWATRYSS